MSDNAANTTVTDSTGANNGTNLNNTSGKSTTGQINKALTYVSAAVDKTTTSMAKTTAMTWELWVQATTLPHGDNSMITIDGANYLLMDISVTNNGDFWSADGMAANSLGMTASFVTGNWYHIALVREGDSTTGGYKAYQNGVFKGSANTGTLNAGNIITLGNRPDTSGQEWNGYEDEVRISNVARSADWIKTEYNNQSSPSTFYSLSAETAVSAGSGTPHVQLRGGGGGKTIIRGGTGGGRVIFR